MEREYRVQRLNDFMFVHNVTFFSSTDLLVIQTFLQNYFIVSEVVDTS